MYPITRDSITADISKTVADSALCSCDGRSSRRARRNMPSGAAPSCAVPGVSVVGHIREAILHVVFIASAVKRCGELQQQTAAGYEDGTTIAIRVQRTLCSRSMRYTSATGSPTTL